MAISSTHFRLKENGEPNAKCLCVRPELIENYNKAISDTHQTWICHHRLETHTSDGEKRLVQLTKKELEALDMYYNRPPEELIFLTRADHIRIHEVGKEYCFTGKEHYWKEKGTYTAEQKKRMSESAKKRTNRPLLQGNTIRWLRQQDSITVVSGYFAATIRQHSGYQKYFQAAFDFNRPVLVILSNRNQWLHKYGLYSNRMTMIKHTFPNVKVLTSIDKDQTQCATLTEILKYCPNVYFFKDGSEYNIENLPEAKVEGIKIIFGNNPKEASSSEILGLTKNEG